MTPFRLQRLDHVSLNVSDRSRSIAWYRDVLGLELRNEPRADDWPAFMGEFGKCIGLFQAQDGPPPGRRSESVGFRHLAFMLGKDDLERAQAHFRAKRRRVPVRGPRERALRLPARPRRPRGRADD